MKVFLRSDSGLRNLNKFYRAECICYVEGGGINYSVESIISENKYTDSTRDITFWKNIFQTFTKLEKVKFKSIGSKTVLLKLSRKIIDNKLRNTIICMDSEYDEIGNRKIDHANHIYTYGYSIENDIFNIENVIQILSANIGFQITDTEEIKMNIDYFFKKLKKYISYDYYSFENALKFIDREKPSKNLKISNDNYPLLNIELFEEKCKELSLEEEHLNDNLCVEKHCFGHLVEHFFMQTIRTYLNKNNISSYSQTAIINQLIFNCTNTFSIAQRKYYIQSLSTINLN